MTADDEEAHQAEFDARASAEWKRIEEAPRIRTFPFLNGWAVLFMPIDVFEFRGAARMYFGTMYGFKPDELTALRARRNIDDEAPERTYWAIAIAPTAYRRWRRRAARRRLAALRAKGEGGSATL